MVIHYTGMSSHHAALERLCDPAAEVSAHWLISETGDTLALVPEDLRAWHAGAGAWGAVRDVNSRSIGIELANPGDRPFPEPQIAALERLLADILARWAIPPERVIAHSDMAPGRKIDPGPRFDWRRLALGGLSVRPEVSEGAEGGNRGNAEDREAGAAFHAAVRDFGYPDLAPDLVLTAFRLRFRPWARGPVQAADAALAADLARRFPVDGAGTAA